MQINLVIFREEDFEEYDDDEYTYLESYPVEPAKRPGRPKKTAPYTIKTPQVLKRQEKSRESIKQDGILDEQIEEIIREDIPISKSFQERKLRKSKKYALNLWDQVSKMTILVQVRQLAEVPTFCQ